MKVVVFVVVDRFVHYMHTDNKIQHHNFRRQKQSSMPDRHVLTKLIYLKFSHGMPFSHFERGLLGEKFHT